MKPIIVENSKLPALLSFVIPIGAITLWPFIFFRGEANERVTNHESIHIAQYNELFVLGFLFLYVFDFLKGLVKYRDKEVAYMMIRFEKEAYENDDNLEYLKNREKFYWKKFKI